ncbi:polyhydroxyalkanoate synthesis repressor PhaR [Ottowia thiooxydans]|uniref:polyhydroxyalkanoate synthesis repressor PhaR n=1 Tax=Ottowia thiooxydans TaxID=219182 RepID=UPI00042A5E09|nr:polyhydroxyalkanoate synthesis repressor PhaR [Ottowia thiooxydans]
MTSSTKPSDAPGEAAGAADAVQQRIIKKYPNRRLYDTRTSSYITLAEVRKLVMAAEPFVVRDAKSGDDLTRSILLQIILEEEAGGAPMFSEAVLANIIRFYGHSMQAFMGTYLEKNIQSLMEVQAKLAEQSPVMQGMMGSYLEQSKSAFAQMQEQMQKQTEQVMTAFGMKR